MYNFLKCYISELERGRSLTRLVTLKILARSFDLPISYFYEGIPEDRTSTYRSRSATHTIPAMVDSDL
jgi:transcriptional regulator with XRE-family HTH domain